MKVHFEVHTRKCGCGDSFCGDCREYVDLIACRAGGPVDPVSPTPGPVGPVTPAPVGPVAPVAPVDPALPGLPVTPVLPVEPIAPGRPRTPTHRHGSLHVQLMNPSPLNLESFYPIFVSANDSPSG